MSVSKDRTGLLRRGLFAKYVTALVGLVIFVLAVNGLTEAWINYRATRTALTGAMADKAEATARRLSQVPAIIQLSQLDSQGREVLRVSRSQVQTGGADFSRDIRFTETMARGLNFAPATFEGTRPMMSISEAHFSFDAAVTMADVDLR